MLSQVTHASLNIRVLPRHVGSKPGSVVVEMSSDAAVLLAQGIEVAFEVEESIHDEYRELATEWWAFSRAVAEASPVDGLGVPS